MKPGLQPLCCWHDAAGQGAFRVGGSSGGQESSEAANVGSGWDDFRVAETDEIPLMIAMDWNQFAMPAPIISLGTDYQTLPVTDLLCGR